MRILLLDLDSTRPDHLGCYGYSRNTSPNIDRIAAEGIRFENCYTTDAPCAPSRTALMSGRFGIHTGLVGHGGTAGAYRHEGAERGFVDALADHSLPSFLRQCGFHTVSISPFAERHAAWTFLAGFSEVLNTGRKGMESAEEVTPAVLDWIRRKGKEDNWFLHVNYWDPHTPYRAPLEFGNPFEHDPLPAWITDEVLEQHMRKVGPHSASEINMYDNRTFPEYPRHPGEIKDRDGLRRMIDGYDCGIRYMDEHIGRLFQALREEGVFDDTAIIITADHGENMGELGIYGEHGTADQATCRIPLIIRWPGLARGKVDDGLHYHIDLLPTLAELLQKEPKPQWDGRSFAPALLRGEACGREYLVFGQCAHVCQRGVRFGDWLYIRTYHDGYHLFPKEMLFQVKEDPHEQHNLADRRPDLCKEAVYYLNEWHDDMMASMPYDTDPLWTVIKEGGPFHAKGRLRAYAERLEQTGRGHAVEELKRRHPREWTSVGG